MKNISKKRTPLVKIVKECNTEYITLNGRKVGVIGGSNKDAELEIITAMTTMYNNDDSIIYKINSTMLLMAELEDNNVNISFSIDTQVGAFGYDINTHCLYNEVGICCGEYDPQDVTQEVYEEYGEPSKLNIITEPNVFEVIRVLKTLGLKSSYWGLEGKRQSFPIAYKGDASWKEFESLVANATKNGYDYNKVIQLACDKQAKDESKNLERE